MIYDFVPFHEVAEEIAMNLEKHYDDVDKKDGYGRPNLDWDTYLAHSKAGSCMAVTVRENGKLVAYSVFCMGVNMNHKTVIEATNTGMWIDEKYRGKIIQELIRNSDDFLHNAGVMEIIYILMDERIGTLLKRAKYTPKHTVWSKKDVTISTTLN